MKLPAPGPYEVVIVEAAESIGRDGSKWVMIRNEGGAIATVYPAKEAEATARLLAAAWDLLEAVILAIPFVEGKNERVEQVLRQAKTRAEGTGLAAIYKPAPVERSVFDEAPMPGEAK